MHHYLTVNCIISNCSTSMHCEPLCSISSSALLATDELFICTVSIYVWWLNNTVQRHISALHIHCKGSYDWLGSTFDLYTCDHVYMSAVDYNAQYTNTVHYWLPRIGCILPFDAFFAGNYAVAAHYPALLNSNHRQCTGSAGSALYLHLDPSATADVSYPHCSTQWRQSSYISQPWWWWLWWQSIEIDIKYIKISGMGWDICTGGNASVPWSSKHLSQSFLYSGWIFWKNILEKYSRFPIFTMTLMRSAQVKLDPGGFSPQSYNELYSAQSLRCSIYDQLSS